MKLKSLLLSAFVICSLGLGGCANMFDNCGCSNGTCSSCNSGKVCKG